MMCRTVTLLFFLLLSVSSHLHAQVDFVVVESGDSTDHLIYNSVKEYSLGGYIVTGGGYQSSSSGHAIVARYSDLGNLMWSTNLDSICANCYGFDLIEDLNGDIVASGYTNGSGLLLVKIDSTGNFKWVRQGGASWGQSIVSLGDGQYITAGANIDRVDSVGTIWTISLSSFEQIMYLHENHEGNFLAYGFENFGSGIYGDVFLKCFDTIGNLLWTRDYGMSLVNSINNCLEVGSDSCLLMVGRSYQNQGALIKTSKTGDTLWFEIYPQFSFISSIQEMSNGDLLIAGMSNANLFMLAHTDSLGGVICTEYFGSNEGWAKSVLNASNGAYISTGGHDPGGTESLEALLISRDQFCGPNYASIDEVPDLYNPKGLILYPNPANTLVSVDFSDDSDLRLILYNVVGQKVLETEIVEGSAVDVSHVEHGLYQAILISNSKVVSKQSFEIVR